MSAVVSREGRRALRWGAVALACVTATGACKKAPPRGGLAPAPVTPVTPDEVAESVYEGGLKAGWQDLGWCPRSVGGPGPAELHLAKRGALGFGSGRIRLLSVREADDMFEAIAAGHYSYWRVL